MKSNTNFDTLFEERRALRKKEHQNSSQDLNSKTKFFDSQLTASNNQYKT